MTHPFSQLEVLSDLTCFHIYHQPDQINHYLRFGKPQQIKQFGRYRAEHYFLPGEVACYIRWRAGEFGTIDWQLAVLQTGRQGDKLQKIPGVEPGVHILLNAVSESQVRRAFEMIDALEGDGFEPATVSPHYYRHCHTGIQTGQEFHPYSDAQHQAWQAEKVLKS